MRLHLFWLATVWGVLLTAGCHSTTTRPPLVRHAGSPRIGDVAARAPSVDSPSEQDIIAAHAHYAAATIHDVAGEASQALDEYCEAARRDPGDEDLVLEVTGRLLVARDYTRAVEILTRATSLPGASPTLYARLGLAYSRNGNTKDAELANRTAIRKDPGTFSAYQNLFVAALQAGRTNEAIGILDDAARVPKTTPEFLVGIAELYGAAGVQVPEIKATTDARGLAVLNRAAAISTDNPNLELRIGSAFSLFGQEAEAAKVFERLVQKLPEQSLLRDGLRAKLAQIYMRENNSDRAAEQLTGMLQDNPTDVQAHFFLGQIAEQANDYAQAIEHFSKVLLLSPGAEAAYYHLADVQISAGRGADALATLERARQQFSSGFLVEYLSGLANTVEKNYTNAAANFRAAEIIGGARSPDRLTAGFHFQFGVACERAGDFEGAVKEFEKCLVLSPDMHEAQNYLGYMLADRGEQLERARELITKALNAEPGSAAYLDSMGWVLFRLNKPEDALKYVLEAVEKSEEADATLFDHLGDIYAKLGRNAEAREAWQKSIGVEPSDAVQKKLDSVADRQSAPPE